METLNDEIIPVLVGGVGELCSNNNTQFYQQDRVYDSEFISISITTAFLPYYLIRTKQMDKIIIAGKLQGNYDISNRVYSVAGIAPAQTVDMSKDVKILVKQATKDGYIEIEDGGVFDGSYPDSETRRGRVQDRGLTSPSITAQKHDIFKVENYRIRRLTPTECFRLMGVKSEDAEKMLSVNSESQCYKQAGNSIVVDVMVAMFRELI